MLEFVISTILSGIIWDVIKGSQKLLYHYSLKKMNIAEAELTNLIENIPQEEKNNKKLVIEYLKEDSEYQILLKQAVRNVRSANLKKRMTVIVLVVIIVLGAGHYYLGVMDGQFRSFSNDYVQVVYNGLQKKEVTPISPEGDTYFYNNWWDLKRKKYIRVVKFYGDTGIDDSIKMMEGDEAERDMFVDICTSQQIYHTLQYASPLYETVIFELYRRTYFYLYTESPELLYFFQAHLYPSVTTVFGTVL